MRDSLPPMGKFLRLRWVCAPQYRVSSTMISPKASDSVLALDATEEVSRSCGPEVAKVLIVTLFARGSKEGSSSGGVLLVAAALAETCSAVRADFNPWRDRSASEAGEMRR